MSSSVVTWKGTLRQLFILLRPLPTYPPPSHTTVYIREVHVLIHTGKGGGVVLNQREGKRGNRVRITKMGQNTSMTECTQKIGYLQSINSLCVELENVPLITFWSKILGEDDNSIVVCISFK
jgi:hypothetical protein